ncbi:hypothetical protein [Celeribacter neptunius]|uniref:Uncharacterized protein n=1 Tax=Celeribacter neptunius TaxID=588602 RepID=A0A1I3NZP8_9RHOB|nr:hypothetical protein [Celeribacter neptunius]SFJ14775.1 hypothetical protein SAMN04487991_1520 [Celeribacter neptunius]
MAPRGKVTLATLSAAARVGMKAGDAFDPKAIGALSDHISDEMIDAVAGLSAREADDLLELAQKSLLLPNTYGRDFLKQIVEITERARLKGLEKRIQTEIHLFGIPAVFEPGLTNFSDAIMRRQYNKYAAQTRKTAFTQGKPPKVKDAYSWALSTGSAKGKSRLKQLLGDDYIVQLKALRPKGVLIDITSREAIEFGRLVRRGPIPYAEWLELKDSYNSVRRGTLGTFAEGDHVFEQHVIRNDPRGNYIVDITSQGPTMVVAKSPHAARLLEGRGQKTPYIHSIKTQALRELIPYELVQHFSPQQIWDAHIEALKRAGLTKMPPQLIADLQLQFDLYTEAFRRGGLFVSDINYRTAVPANTFHPSKWKPEWQ